MRSWTSTVAVMQKNRAQPRSASPLSASSSEMGNDRWLHHMSQTEPLFFFLVATTFSVAVLLGGGRVSRQQCLLLVVVAVTKLAVRFLHGETVWRVRKGQSSLVRSAFTNEEEHEQVPNCAFF